MVAVPAMAQTAASARDLTRALNTRPAAQPVASLPRAPEAEAKDAETSSTAPVVKADETETEAEPAPRPAPEPVALDAAAIAALPFRIDLYGARIFERPAGPQARIYSVRRGDTPLLMIYAGPQSSYPIYDGDQANVAGRVSVVLTEGTTRRAVEHLFRREDRQPADIHVWLLATDGRDGALAEQIGQTVDPR